MFTDTHCHITNEDYNILECIQNAKSFGIYKMINNGFNQRTNEEVLDISQKYPNIYAAIGIHPQELKNYTEENLKFIEKNIDNIVAIGEIGLDYYNGYPDRELQKEVLRAQLALATKYKKPVIIHSRESTEDTINILMDFPTLKGVIHCFSGSVETAMRYIKMGYKLGLGGVLTFKNSKLYQVVEQIPLDSILLETDAPYLSPEPLRGTKNEPANVHYIAKRICEIKNIDMKELSKITEKNVREIFDI